MKYKLPVVIIGLFISYISSAQQTRAKDLPTGCIQLTPAEMVWTDTLSTLPKGAKFCLLYGDIKTNAPFAVRIQFAPNTVLKTHYHKSDEVVTVLEGSLSIGFGKNEATGALTPGSFYVNAANIEHYVQVGNKGATIQINSIGPWTVVFK